jgi:hypothetical protein
MGKRFTVEMGCNARSDLPWKEGEKLASAWVRITCFEPHVSSYGKFGASLGTQAHEGLTFLSHSDK